MNTYKTLKDYQFIPDKDAFEKAKDFQEFINQMDYEKSKCYGIISNNGTGAYMKVDDIYSKKKIETISFVGNDYLGLSKHPDTIQAGIDAVKKYGTGSCASPIIGGYLDIHSHLESKIATSFNFEDAIIYSSGYAANCSSIAALLTKKDIALVDMFVHSSVYDGLHQTNFKILPHNNIEYLNKVLSNYKDKYLTKLVIIDGIYSQDGDIAPVNEILEVCHKNGAYLMVDDAHGIGVYGKNGKGTLEHFDLLGEVDILTGTFSKSYGSVGGFVTANEKVIQYLRYYSRFSTFSAAPTPQATASVTKAIDIIQNDKDRRKRLWDNVNYLQKELKRQKFDIGMTESPITPIMIRNDQKAQKAARMLIEKGIYVIPIIYPGVKKNDSRLRVTVTAEHEKKDLKYFIKTLIDIDNTLSIRKMN